MNIKEELNRFNLTEEQYENLLSECHNRVYGITDISTDWEDICDKYDLPFHRDSLRKSSQLITGGAFVKQYYEEKFARENNDDSYLKELDKKLEDIRKEKIKIQTLNIERNRIDRAEARQELFYEYIGSQVNKFEVPEFEIIENNTNNRMHYILTISDIHYGADFSCLRNIYNPSIVEDRFNTLLNQTYQFVKTHKINTLTVINLGDNIQGILRASDLKINDSSIVEATVKVSRIIAAFLNKLSNFVNVEYYHVPTSNHTQIRPLGTKASEIADEDLEYVIKNYIKDLVQDNSRINIEIDSESDYIEIKNNCFNIYATHGHSIKNYNNAIKDVTNLMNSDSDYIICGHIHEKNSISGGSGVFHDKEVIVAPSFVGADPYSERLMKASHSASCIYGFNEQYGLTETYKIILD